jgi:hypothetical protein
MVIKPLIIVSEKRIVFNPVNGILPIQGENKNCYCPLCGGLLKYRDRRRRICRMEGGKTYHCMVRRLWCSHCCRLHTELPQDLSPNKHYVNAAVEDVLDGVTSEEDPLTADGPSAQTMYRWRKWFRKNLERIHGGIRHAYTEAQDTELSPDFASATLEKWRSEGSGWLCRALACVYNFGGFLVPFY